MIVAASTGRGMWWCRIETSTDTTTMLREPTSMGDPDRLVQ
jgi:hypothetical protein